MAVLLQMQDLAVLEEVIRMVLEIINSCLASALHHNPNLVYTLLYQKDLFGMFRTHPTFQDIIVNIDTVSRRDVFGEPACGGQDIVVTTLNLCMCLSCAYVHLSRFTQAIACTFMHGFQNNLAQLFSLRNRSAF